MPGETTLSEFISSNLEPILREWEEFAVWVHPRIDVTALRDHAREMLIAIATDMRTDQTSGEQQAKSRGNRRRDPAKGDSAAETHGGDRVDLGFTFLELVAEFRALRASVIRLWTREVRRADQADLDDLTRFNEAIDEALTESAARYWSRIESARSLLLGALGHDLRNPLAAIHQAAQVLLRDDLTRGVYASAAARILTSGDRMGRLVSDLLDFARTQLGDHLPLTPIPMDMADACRATIDEMSVLHPEHVFELDCDNDLTGSWDAERIAQMLSNLVGNAAEHGAPRTTIFIKAWSTDSELRVSVHNEGPPIPEQERRRIFEPLARAANNGSGKSGAGLGLYIASEIAKAHGGDVELTSSDETGTTFTAFFPRR